MSADENGLLQRQLHPFTSGREAASSSPLFQAPSRHEYSDQAYQFQQSAELFSTSSRNQGVSTDAIQNAPIKWMSSKMRLMRKMMSGKHISAANKPRRRIPRHPCQQDEIRVCSGCSTTKTPLWRSGPQGPKSLCNACGIRRMKARRAVAAAPPENGDRTVPFKKRYKFSNGLQESSSPSVFHPAFPQDEKDAAILLMALSCG